MNNDGGPAFPSEQGHTLEYGWNQSWEPGMFLRDYFAAHAPECVIRIRGYEGEWYNSPASAYSWADKMLEARKLGNQKEEE